MIIICPECATRYNVDDEAFLPKGRSVRCTSCKESWFVPAPEPLDAALLEEEYDASYKGSSKSRLKVAIDEGREARRFERSPHNHDDYEDAGYEDADYEDDEDDALFDAPLTAKKSHKKEPEQNYDPLPRDEKGRFTKVKKAEKQDHDEGPAQKRWRKGKQFIVEDEVDEDDDAGDRPFFGRFSKKDNNKPPGSVKRRQPRAEKRADERDALRFADEDEYDDLDFGAAYEDGDVDDGLDYRDDGDTDHGVIVDADWEVVGDNDSGREFGRRVRTERRRATALARMEDVRRFDPSVFDDEFFASLRVTPRELEKAVRKARRRAESRDKNRMTPMRAFGWSAWIAAVAGTLYGVVAYRDEIVKFAPATADAYAVVGIDTNPFGLAIENVRHRLAMSTGGPMIEISGNLTNPGEAIVDAPLLQAEALGPRGELLARWTFAPSAARVAQGADVEFVTRAPAPDGVSEVALSFAPTANAVKGLLPGVD